MIRKLLMTCLFLSFIGVDAAFAQDPTGVQWGINPYAPHQDGSIDSVQNGHLVLSLPLVSYPERGSLPPLAIDLRWQGAPWQIYCNQNPDGSCLNLTYGLAGNPNLNEIAAGNVGVYAARVGSMSADVLTAPGGYDPTSNSCWCYAYVTDEYGGGHQLVDVEQGSAQYAIDGSGYFLTTRNGHPVVGNRSGFMYDLITGDNIDFDGNRVTPVSLGWTDPNHPNSTYPIPTPGEPGASPTATVTTDPDGSTCYLSNYPNASYTFCFKTLQVTTQFSSLPSHYVNGSATLVTLTRVSTPAGDYKFSFDSWGDLTDVYLPTGGSIHYEWESVSNPTGTEGTNVERYLLSRTLKTSSSDPGAKWSYNFLGNSGTAHTIINPDLSSVNIIPAVSESGIPFTTTTDYYDQSGRELKKTVSTPAAAQGCNDFLQCFQQPSTVTTSLFSSDGSQQVVSRVCYTYDAGSDPCSSNPTPLGTMLTAHDPNSGGTIVSGQTLPSFAFSTGSVVRKDQYDFGGMSASPSVGSLLNRTETTYEWQQDTSFSYLSAGLTGPPSLVSTGLAGAGSIAKTQYVYDETGPSASGTALSSPGAHGHATTVQRWSDTANAWLTTHNTYDANGMMIEHEDANSVAGSQANTPQNRYLTKTSYQCADTLPYVTTPPNGYASTDTYVCETGWLYSQQDPNDTVAGRSGVVYDHDSIGNIRGVSYQDGGGHSVDFHGYQTANHLTFTTFGTPSQTIDAYYDPLGRETSRAEAAPQGTITVQKIYDSMGRIQAQSTPYAGSATGWTSYQFDGLGRVTLQCDSDNGPSTTTCSASALNSKVTTAYSGNQTAITDEAGNTLVQVNDALGRLTSVTEPGNLATSYTYDGLGDLLGVNQHGLTRQFTYNSLSQLITATNPESGTVCYGTPWTGPCQGGYDPNGNLLVTTDARGQNVFYSYDQMNRVTQKTSFGAYNPWSMKKFVYDTAPTGWGVSVNNALGHLAWAQSLNVSSDQNKPIQVKFYSYDPVGRRNVLSDLLPQEIGAQAPATTIGYDTAGRIIDMTYPDGRHVTQKYDIAGQLSMVSDGTSQSPGAPYISSISYAANGSPLSIVYGNGITETLGINSRQQLCNHAVGPSSGTSAPFFSRQYFYAQNPSGTDCSSNETTNNGNIYRINDLLPGAIGTQSARYDDHLNRLTHWEGTLSGSYQTLDYSYDTVGNLANPSIPTAGNASIGLTFDSATNRISNLNCSGLNGASSYDVSGHVMCSGSGMSVYGYEWGQLGELAEVWQYQNNNNFNNSLKARYFYDEAGSRIRAEQYAAGSSTPNSTRDYAYFDGKVLGEIDNNNVWTDYVYANGRKIARVEATDHRIRLSGNQVGSYEGGTQVNVAGTYAAAGDRVCWQQYNDNAVGGIDFGFDNGHTAWQQVGDDGQQFNQDYTQGGWQNRCGSIPSWFYGHQFVDYQILHDVNSPSGVWTMLIADLVYIQANGTVIPLFTSGMVPFSSDSAPIGDGAGGSIQRVIEDVSASADSYIGNGAPRRVHYVVGDQVGTAQLELSSGGYPTWKGEFGPFGQELDVAPTSNRYKFTGKERDAESGLDDFGPRYYTSSMGRFMSPDPLGGHMENPQSLNKYAYALNNPLTNTDPTGLDSYLQCTSTKDNASTCQSQTVGYDSKGNAQTATVQGVTGQNGQFTATQIGNDANGNLVDKTTGTGSYTASVNGSGVQFSNNGGQSSSSGVFVNGTPQNTFQDAGFANGGALSGFNFTLTNSKMEANQSEAGTFTFAGTPEQAGQALLKAGFYSPLLGENVGQSEYRSPGSFWTGSNSTHVNVDQINLAPRGSLPMAGGDFHTGEHNLKNPIAIGYHCFSDHASLCP